MAAEASIDSGQNNTSLRRSRRVARRSPVAASPYVVPQRRSPQTLREGEAQVSGLPRPQTRGQVLTGLQRQPEFQEESYNADHDSEKESSDRDLTGDPEGSDSLDKRSRSPSTGSSDSDDSIFEELANTAVRVDQRITVSRTYPVSQVNALQMSSTSNSRSKLFDGDTPLQLTARGNAANATQQ